MHRKKNCTCHVYLGLSLFLSMCPASALCGTDQFTLIPNYSSWLRYWYRLPTSCWITTSCWIPNYKWYFFWSIYSHLYSFICYESRFPSLDHLGGIPHWIRSPSWFGLGHPAHFMGIQTNNGYVNDSLSPNAPMNESVFTQLTTTDSKKVPLVP